MGPDLIARLGLNKDKYSQGLREAEKDFKDFSKRTSEHGRGTAEQLTHSFRGVHEVLKAFGAITVFREFLGWFQDLSEYAKKFGDQTDENTRAAIRWGAAYKQVKGAFESAGVQILGFFTRSAEGWGAAVRYVAGDSLENIRRDQAGSDDAAQAEASRDAYMKENDPEKVKALRKEIAAIDKELGFSRMTDEQKITSLEKDQAQILAEKGQLGIHDTKKMLQLELEMHQNAEKAAAVMKHAEDDLAEKKKQAANKEAELHKQREERIKELGEEERSELQKIQDLKGQLARASTDRGKMTLRELASVGRFAPGVSLETEGQSMEAREALGLQGQAEKARKSGDFNSALSLFSQADSIIHGLTGDRGALRSTEDPVSAVLNRQLDKANERLDAIDTKLAGKFSAED